MKYVIIIGDGMGDEPQPALGGKTPLEAAYIPNMAYLATQGRVGRMTTLFKGLPLGSIVANLGILGYDPHLYHPDGRASFEALANGISLGPRDIAFRCNLISVDEQDKISDFTAGLISNSTAIKILSDIPLTGMGMELEIYPGQSYRNTLVLRNAEFSAKEIRVHEPHTNIGTPFRDVLTQGLTPKAVEASNQLNQFLLRSKEIIGQMPVYKKEKASMLWLWSPSSKPNLPSFRKMFGLSGAVVCGLDFLRGIAVSGDLNFEKIPGATGYIDTDYRAKAEYAIRFLQNNDFVFVHINAPDEEGHQHNVPGKVQSIEFIDELVTGPIIRYLRQKHPNDFRVMICPDHYTRLRDGQHTMDNVPFLIYGSGVVPGQARGYSENTAQGDPVISHQFAKQFFSTGSL